MDARGAASRRLGSRGVAVRCARGGVARSTECDRLENEAEAIESAVCWLEEPTPVFYSTLGGNWMPK